jgi:hypothetical protein
MSLLSTLILDAGEQPPQTYDGKTLSVSEVQGDSVKHTYMPIGEEVSEAEFNARFRSPTPMFNVSDFFRRRPSIKTDMAEGKRYFMREGMGTPSDRDKEFRTPFGGESYLAEQFAGGIPTKLTPEARQNIMNALLATQMQKTKQGML